MFAKKNGGTFILRIEDTDREREVEGATERLKYALKLAGLDWDEGPDVGGDYGPYVQTQRRGLYAPYAWKLVESGAAYPCFCTNERLDEERGKAERDGQTFKYDKRCKSVPLNEAKRRIDAGEPYVIRLDMPTEGTIAFDDIHYGHIEVECRQLDDIILMKADGLPTYNFANVVDDHLMEITHVLRGTEFLSSTPKYNFLYKAFGWEKPIYIHLPLVMADSTRKLSKRHGDPTFEDLLNEGYLADAVVNYIALLGWNPGDEREFFTLPELVEAFTLEGLSKSPSIFDKTKLTWMNGEYMRRLSFEDFFARAGKYIEETLPGKDAEYLARLLHGRVDVLSQIPQTIDFLRELPEYDSALYVHKKMKTDEKNSIEALAFALPILEGVSDWTEPAVKDALLMGIANAGRKNGAVLWPLRVALSGLMNTPGGATEIAYLLGKEETTARANKAIARLSD
jgi:glutamyl-tRNA synthetase